MTLKNDVELALKKVINKFDKQEYKALYGNFTKLIQFTFPDLKTSYLIKVTNGNVESFKEEKIDNPNIHLTIDSNNFLDILNKKIKPMAAYTTGKLKVKGNMLDVLKLQKIL